MKEQRRRLQVVPVAVAEMHGAGRTRLGRKHRIILVCGAAPRRVLYMAFSQGCRKSM